MAKKTHPLDSQQRSSLTKKAQRLKPIVMVGKSGLTDEVIKAVTEALESHELIKVKFVDYKDEKKDLSRVIADKTDSQLVRLIGNIAIYYWYQPDPDKRRISVS
ncbi:YhbY family RNA-binding protein [Spirochaeta cellobiosiphila]|uniref:YhbY family RNA-binding protein n=1 Tax=Spirochaeta cellobiosiphila TaxID=504483 RepID=UPI00040B2EAD|nr:YhbY family RNA-binding protein [Spirochaeta cellobiosiphila]